MTWVQWLGAGLLAWSVIGFLVWRAEVRRWI